jgi:hypothetical protein
MPCLVCDSPHRLLVEHLRESNTPYRTIAKNTGLSLSSVFTHCKQHTGNNAITQSTQTTRELRTRVSTEQFSSELRQIKKRWRTTWKMACQLENRVEQVKARTACLRGMNESAKLLLNLSPVATETQTNDLDYQELGEILAHVPGALEALEAYRKGKNEHGHRAIEAQDGTLDVEGAYSEIPE